MSGPWFDHRLLFQARRLVHSSSKNGGCERRAASSVWVPAALDPTESFLETFFSILTGEFAPTRA